jgi:hypothetical protein
MSHTPDWPPATLFDAVYASAVLHNFGTQKLKDAVSKVWKDSFDSGGIMTGVGAQERYEAHNGHWPRYFRHAPGSAICSCFTGNV